MRVAFLGICLAAFAQAAIKCSWEYREKTYIGRFAAGDSTKFETLDEAKERCIELGTNCNGVTMKENKYTVRASNYFSDHHLNQSWKKECTGFKVSSISPKFGSSMGGTRITITGQGFSTNQFSYDDSSLGNQVVFWVKSDLKAPVKCNVIPYYSSSTKIVCDLSKPADVSNDRNYKMKVSVDGVWMETSKTNIYCGGECMFYVRWVNMTPYIDSTPEPHVPAGSVLQFGGKIWSASFAANSSEADQKSYISRIYLNALKCNPTDGDDVSYGTALTVDENGDATHKGMIKCKSSSPGPTSYRPSFINSKRGRSKVLGSNMKVDTQMQKYAIQTYNVIASISPVSGSTEGGAKVTISSEYLHAPKSKVHVEIGGEECSVSSLSATEIVCSSPAQPNKDFYPGNRGVYTEYWTMDTDKTIAENRILDPELIRNFDDQKTNYKFSKWNATTRPSSLYDLETPKGSDNIPYYVRMRFFLKIQETDLYGFYMISEHSGQLYVSTDDTKANAVKVANCSNVHNNWNQLQTDIKYNLQAGRNYYVEFVGVMWNLKQRFGVGLAKKKTPFPKNLVKASRIEYPYWKWTQAYDDEIQEIDLEKLMTKETEGFKLKLGDRETPTLYASSNEETVSKAIMETFANVCPTIDAAKKWYHVSLENSVRDKIGGYAKDDIQPFCGNTGVAVNTWTLFWVNSAKKVFEWDPSGEYKYICWAMKTNEKRISMFYEVKYQDSSFKWRVKGVWRSGDDMIELKDNNGEWQYNCVNMFERVTKTDWDWMWKSKIGSRSWKLLRVLLGIDITKTGDYFTDEIMITTEDISADDKRVEGAKLSGGGVLKSVTVKVTNPCSDGSDCTGKSGATTRKWTVTMDTRGCGYNFPLIAISGKAETKVSNDQKTYKVGTATVTVKRTSTITKELQGTFDLTIDGVTHKDIPVHISSSDFLKIIRKNGDYQAAHRWGSCYNRQWRLERTHPGHHGWHQIDSSKVVAKKDLKEFVKFKENERGGLVMTPIYGDWIRSAHATPQVSLQVNGITGACPGNCDFKYLDTVTPTFTAILPTSGTTNTELTITGTSFGTDNTKVTVSVGKSPCTVSVVTENSITCTVTDNVAKDHNLLIYVDGKGNAKNINSVKFSYTGSVASVNPKTGSVGGGTLVTITGTGFDKENAGVKFGASTATVKSASYTELTVLTPASTDGDVAIVITGDTGFNAPSTSIVFSYSADSMPKINTILPILGSVAGGTDVTLTGELLDQATKVTIGGVMCAEISKTATEYKCRTGESDPGQVDVRMETQSSGFAAGSVKFTYKLEVYAISPVQGSVVGGTIVTISGAGFGTDSSLLDVAIGEYSCEVTEVTDSEIKCTTPSSNNANQLTSEYETPVVCNGMTLAPLQQTIQDTHNMYRARNLGTEPLCFSSELTKSADRWAKYLAKEDLFKASSSSGHGENLMMFEHYGLKSDEAYIRDALSSWYSQRSSYQVADPSKALFYTQLVWKKTENVGCVVEKNTAVKPNKVYVVCHYSPAGNIAGKFDSYIGDIDSSYHKNVTTLQSESDSVTVYLKTHKAVKTNGAAPSAGDCAPVTSKISGCTDKAPMAAGGDLDYSFYSCFTPKITKVTKQVAFNGEITITGTGFHARKCAITVKLGADHKCTVKTATPTSIVCVPDISTEPPVATLFKVGVHVLGRGDAIFEGTDYQEGFTYLTPFITDITPTSGSFSGGTVIQINGGGFKYVDNDIVVGNEISDGNRVFKVLSATYTRVTVQNKAGATGNKDVKSTIVFTQDKVPIECAKNQCDFTYDISETSVVTSVSPLKVTEKTTLTIMGTKVCSKAQGTSVTVGSVACTTEKCTDKEMTCTLPAIEAGKYNLKVTQKNGYTTIPDEFSTISAQFTVTSVTPSEGSVNGGTAITITGTQFPTASTRVRLSGVDTTVTSSTTAQIIAVSPKQELTADKQAKVSIEVNGIFIETKFKFTFKVSKTPKITTITPTEGSFGTDITVAGENLVNPDVADQTSIFFGETENCYEGFETNQKDYRGDFSRTKSGLTCQKWSVQEPHSHRQTPEKSSAAGIGDHNYCRNPDGDAEGSWCYTTSKELRRETCGIPSCNKRKVQCTVKSATATSVVCTLGDSNPGKFTVLAFVKGVGNSNSDVTMTYNMELTGTTPPSPSTGTLGGHPITLNGAGFAPDDLQVEICGVDVAHTRVSSRQLTVDLPACPADKCIQSTSACDVMVRSGKQTKTLSNKVSYEASKTPSITSITPDNAGTGGGKSITIEGTGFSDTSSEVSVKFDGVPCTVKTASTTQIVCTTQAKTDLANQEGVEVRINGGLSRNPNNVAMRYIDKWSSKFTWGGNDPPVAGDLVVIKKGQMIYLDESTPVLKALLIRGGHLIFLDESDITLKMEYALILDGGSITVGTEAKPFEHEAIIEMFGNQQSVELPLYGAKTIAVRNGTVDLHGKQVTPNWTELGETAKAGTSTIKLNTVTNWKVGDQIAISSSSFSPAENEQFKIKAISQTGGVTTIELDGALRFDHISLVQTIRGVKLTTAAKVGHLTRNVKMRGNVNKDHIQEIDACPQEFDPDQFAGQSCFEGRYGDEIDSDQFGSQLMFHAAAMETHEVKGRLENAEFTWAGQAFKLGRYPIHFHMNGDVTGSYVKGCAVHHTFNRAVTVHGVDNLVVKDNVAFNNMGHAFFLEDGGEENNLFEGNLAIFTKSSSSLLNVDVTPASFWIVNPHNRFINNVAAGGTHFGFWFNMPLHPMGPSATDKVCPRNKGILEFKGNEAHSMGRYGVWVFEHWHPRGDGSCESTAPKLTTLEDFHGWHNLRGSEIADGSAIEMKNFILHDNWFSNVEIHKCDQAVFEEGNTRLTNSKIFAKTKSSDGLTMKYMPETPTFQCGTGVKTPISGLFSVHNTDFHDFTNCPVFESDGGARHDFIGGFPSEFKGITYHNSPKKGSFKWEFEHIFRDLDGTLGGNSNGVVIPKTALVDPASCSDSAEWSHGAHGGVVCDSKTKMVRLSWNKPSLQALLFKYVYMTNEHGEAKVPYAFKRITHKEGWMATLPIGKTYNMRWDYEYSFTNSSYKMGAYYPSDGDSVVIKQVLKDEPDYLTVGGSANKVDEVKLTDDAGSFKFDNTTKTLSYLITGKGVTGTKELKMDLKVYKCFYKDCIDPNPKPLPANPTILQRPENPKKWSVSSDWKGTEEGYGGYNGFLPKEGESVIIPSNWWMIYDTKMTGLDKIYVYGVLEFTNETDTLLGANTIVVVGGKLVVGWADHPLKVEAKIVLTGDRDDTSYTLMDGTEIGSKAIGVAGFVEMNAVYPAVVCSAIKEKVVKGATTLLLAHNVEDGGWKVGDEIIISSTSFLGTEAEKRKITALSGHTITVNTALEHDHDYLLEEIGSHVYKRAAEVGLLTRLITIEGAEDKGHTQSYGARMLVTDYTQTNEDGSLTTFIPVAQIEGVRFKNSGQQGYRDDFDPRYSLALKNTDPAGESSSYIKGCVIDNGFNHGFGILKSHNVDFKDNIVYTVMGSGMRTTSENTDIQNNLVVNVLHYGNYMTPIENDNYYTDACFETDTAAGVILKNNNCGGSERVGFLTQGEKENSNVWENNVAHGCLWGFWVKKSQNPVSKLNKISTWQNYDYGVIHWSESSLLIQNSVIADNWVGVAPFIVGPHPLSHSATDKYTKYSNTLFYGRNPTAACDERKNTKHPTAQLSGLGYHAVASDTGGRLGSYIGNFIGGWTGWPDMSIESPMSYPSIKGKTHFASVTVARYEKCSDLFLSDLSINGDCVHPTTMAGMSYQNVDKDKCLVKIHNPKFGFVNPSDCVDMPCDAKKKILITDFDGSTFGEKTMLISKSEFQWGGEKKWGVGDYRLPNTMTTARDGSAINPATTWQFKGIDRNENKACTFSPSHNLYKCTGVTHRMLVIESLDGDTELRRISPLALSTDDGSVDLINGPMDHGWCGGYTCQQRISTFYAMVITGKVYKLYMSSTQPQSLRYYLLEADTSDKIRLDTFYAKPQRLDLYYKGTYKAPTNAVKKKDGSYSYATDKTPEELYPKITSNENGQNFFDSTAHFMSILIRGSDAYTVRTSPKIVLSLSMESVTVDEFFGKNIITNLAALLNVPTHKIRIAEIVSEGSRKRATGVSLKIEIEESVVEKESEMNDNVTTTMTKKLTKVTEKFVEVVQKGELGKALGAEIKSVSVQMPEAPPKDSRNAKIDKAEAEKTGGETYAEKQKAAAKLQMEAASDVEILEPSTMTLVSSVKEGKLLSNIELKSKVMTKSGDIVPQLGAGDGIWRCSVSVTKGPKNGRILGTTEVLFSGGYASFDDVRLSKVGDYVLKLAVTHPTDFPYEIENIEYKITNKDKENPRTRVAFSFHGDYDTIVTDIADFTQKIRLVLQAKFPKVVFQDVDHYRGSIIVEATVSTKSLKRQDTDIAISEMHNLLKSGFSFKYNGNDIVLSEFSGDSGGGGNSKNTLVVVVVVLLAVLCLVAVGAAFLYYKKQAHLRNKVDNTINMESVKHVDSDPSLTRTHANSNIYENPGAESTTVQTSQLRRRSIQKVWNTMNRRQSQQGDEKSLMSFVDEIGTSSFTEGTQRPGECWTCGENKKKTWACPICGGPSYCSKQCLEKNWNSHHVNCKPRTPRKEADHF